MEYDRQQERLPLRQITSVWLQCSNTSSSTYNYILILDGNISGLENKNVMLHTTLKFCPHMLNKGSRSEWSSEDSLKQMKWLYVLPFFFCHSSLHRFALLAKSLDSFLQK